MAATPATVKKLCKLGATVRVESGAGALAGYADDAYREAGAEIVPARAGGGGPAAAVFAESDLVLKIRTPSPSEATQVKRGALLIGLLMPDQNEPAIEALAARGASALALERIPRITRAQKMDVLSSMANIAGYRAVLEAASLLGDFLGAQVTAAGTRPPAKVLIIGAGVAGLAAIAAARALGAEVRAFDTRAAAKEQVESLGASFLTVDIEEKGEGAGGYAKVMSKEFIEAEMALFRAQAEEVNVVITTALVPGRRAPILLPRDVVDHLRPGAVIVDLAAEQGGNCELTVPGEVVTHNGVRVVGYTDLTSRMAPCASEFFGNNLVNLLGELVRDGELRIDLENDVIRPALVLHQGEKLEPPPAAPAPPPAAPAVERRVSRAPPPEDAKPQQTNIMKPTRMAWGNTLIGLAVIAVVFALGRFAPEGFLQHFTVFILACFVGWQVIWSVSPALHTPLMSVTNAISGVIIVGGMLQAGTGEIDLASILGALAVLVASINIAGGFLVTQRMLKMFRRGDER